MHYFNLISIFYKHLYLLLIFQGVPVIIVALSAGIGSEGYGTPKACWISMDKGHIWVFIGPVIGVILVSLNFVCYVKLFHLLIKKIYWNRR